VWLPRSYCADH